MKHLLLPLAGLLTATLLHAMPVTPTDDAQVLLRLDGDIGPRATVRQWRQQLRQNPLDRATALRLAQHGLHEARRLGDARPAGQALAALAPFGDDPPVEVAVLRATLLQHLHRFDEAIALLKASPTRPPLPPQGWLLLASIHRTQGRLDESDRACDGLAASGARFHAIACRLENQGLRQPHQGLARWEALIGTPGLDAPTQAWLWASKGEQQWRAGQAQAAEASLRQAIGLSDEPHTRVLLADLLAEQATRLPEALALLLPLALSDTVLVRLAHWGERLAHPRTARWRDELQARLALADERQALGLTPIHGREQAWWWLTRDPARALALAERNAQSQREPIDLLLWARAAQAAGQPQALRHALQTATRLEIRDARLPAL